MFASFQRFGEVTTVNQESMLEPAVIMVPDVPVMK